MTHVTADEYELLREQFRPETIRVLFVGESRPANETFFYRGNSRLPYYTCRAFGPVDAPDPTEDEILGFLVRFRDAGCYLVDLCVEPVNHLNRAERHEARRAGETGLTNAIRELQPQAIIVVMKGIMRNVRRAMEGAGLADAPAHGLPFPAMGHEQRYVTGLRDVLHQLLERGILQGI